MTISLDTNINTLELLELGHQLFEVTNMIHDLEARYYYFSDVRTSPDERRKICARLGEAIHYRDRVLKRINQQMHSNSGETL